MSLDDFANEKELEAEGVWCPCGSFRVRLKRAGGTNERYNKAAMRAVKQMGSHRQSLEESRELERGLLADQLIVGWQTMDGDEWVDGIEVTSKLQGLPTNERGLIEPARQHFKKTLDAYPELGLKLWTFASEHDNFRSEELEDVAGN